MPRSSATSNLHQVATFFSSRAPPITRFTILRFMRLAREALAAAALISNLAKMHSVGPDVRIPTFLAFKSMCWSQGLGGQSATYTLQITYQIEDQHGNAMKGAGLAGILISESFSAQTGNLGIKPGPAWTYGTETGIQSDGTFTDNLSAGGLPGLAELSGSMFQMFTAGGLIGRIPFLQPLIVEGLGGTTSVLYDELGPKNVTVNGIGIGTNPATMCPLK